MDEYEREQADKAAAERFLDRELYRPDEAVGSLVSGPENSRVLRLLQLELWREVRARATEEDESYPEAWGKARGRFAEDWVALTTKLGLKGPGDDQRVHDPARKGDRKRDAALTHLRQFLEGRNAMEWVLTGIESTIADRHNMALPGKAYQVQERLDV
jgi:hypothetical protein